MENKNELQNENEFQNEMGKKVEYIEMVLKRYLPPIKGYQKIIFEAIEYSIMAGGKRIRPLLMMETYRLFGGEDLSAIEPFMASIEMIHTYSLVHDDLPAMDNDDYRRGRKTTHIVYGEAMGILAGDALLNLAFETACNAFASETAPHIIGSAIKVLSEKSGSSGMLGGQVVDIETTGKLMEKDKLDSIYLLKTSALIEASMMIGAVLAGAGNNDVERMEKAANGIGMAFQIQDDILDVTSTMQVLGKPIHSDEKNEKTTYVTLEGMEQAKKAVERYSEQAISELNYVLGTNEFLNQLIYMLIHRKK